MIDNLAILASKAGISLSVIQVAWAQALAGEDSAAGQLFGAPLRVIHRQYAGDRAPALTPDERRAALRWRLALEVA